MACNELQATRPRTKVKGARARGPRKRKALTPSTPQMRKRRELSRLVRIGPHGRIRLKNLPPPWRVGLRIYWKVDALRTAIASLTPLGTLRRGRYHSSRLQR